MATGRMINRSVGRDKKLSDYGKEAGAWGLVFHHRLIAFLDRNGNTDANPYFLKGNLFAIDDDVSADDCRKFAGMLEKYDLAISYKSEDGEDFLHFPSFRKNQVGLRWNKERDEFPAYTGSLPENARNEIGMNTENGRENRSEKKRKEEKTLPLSEASENSKTSKTTAKDNGKDFYPMSDSARKRFEAAKKREGQVKYE